MLLVVAMATVFFTSCSKDDETEPIISGGGDNVATMTTEQKEVRLYGNTKKAGDVITIDWGDGNIEEFKTIKVEDEDGEIYYEIEPEHIYPRASTHTIKVTGALIYLACAENSLTSLDVSKCTALTGLSCYGNPLTSLDVSKCTVLEYLNCYYNKFSANTLNKIFTDLPQGKTRQEDDYTWQSSVHIEGNPGTATCNKSIAENKGWEVRVN